MFRTMLGDSICKTVCTPSLIIKEEPIDLENILGEVNVKFKEKIKEVSDSLSGQVVVGNKELDHKKNVYDEICVVCHKTLKNKVELINHYSAHREQKIDNQGKPIVKTPYQVQPLCEYCGQYFSSAQMYITHIPCVNRNLPNFYRKATYKDDCPNKIVNVQDCVMHVNEKRHVDEVFENEKHQPDKPDEIRCVICKETFRTRVDCQRHERRRHQIIKDFYA